MSLDDIRSLYDGIEDIDPAEALDRFLARAREDTAKGISRLDVLAGLYCGLAVIIAKVTASPAEMTALTALVSDAVRRQVNDLFAEYVKELEGSP